MDADPEKVCKGLTKREITIADSTEAAILTLWGGDIDKFSLANSYRFHLVVVHTYRTWKKPTILSQVWGNDHFHRGPRGCRRRFL